MSNLTHRTPGNFFDRAIIIDLVGAGGTGSEVFDGLIRIHKALLALGHPDGLHVRVHDGDTVSSTNTIRQRFLPNDVGLNKAELLVHRANLYHGLDWEAYGSMYAPGSITRNDVPHLVIGCVDRADFRVELAQSYRDAALDTLWLDCGNGSTTGQYVLGHLGTPPRTKTRLPNVYDLFPSLADVIEDDTPSCSTAAALRAQDLFVNRVMADQALNLLYRMLRDGEISTHGGFMDVKAGRVLPLAIDPDQWKMLGYCAEISDSPFIENAA